MRNTLVAGAAFVLVVSTCLVASQRVDAAAAPVVAAIIEGHDNDKDVEILTLFGANLTSLKTFHLVRNGGAAEDIGPVTVLLKSKTQVILRLPDAAMTDPNPDFALALGTKSPTLQIPVTLSFGGLTSRAGDAVSSSYVAKSGAAMTGALTIGSSDSVALEGRSTAMGGIGVQGKALITSQFTHPIAGSVGVSGIGNTGVLGTSDEFTGVGIRAQSYAGLPLEVEQLFQGDIAVFKGGGAKQARIDVSGRGYFNGGTQSSGADFAERVKVDRAASSFEAGDVIAIDPTGTRRFKLSDEAESALVVGVYSTKPAMLAGLSDAMTDAWKTDEVPLGVVGIVPTKVCDEGGAIRSGDLLVAASVAGHAKKAGADPKPGTVIGKALAPFAKGRGKIEVFLVSR